MGTGGRCGEHERGCGRGQQQQGESLTSKHSIRSCAPHWQPALLSLCVHVLPILVARVLDHSPLAVLLGSSTDVGLQLGTALNHRSHG